MSSQTINIYTSLAEIEQSPKGKVFCVNTTPPEERAQLVISVPKNTGTGEEGVYVPMIELPVELTGQVTKHQLLNSSSLRRAITRGLIKLVTEEYYNKCMEEEPDAKERLKAAMADVSEATSGADRMKNAENEDDEWNPETEGVIPKVVMLIDQFIAGDIRPRELIIQIKSLGDLDITNFKYISKKTKDNDMIQAFIKSVREQRGWKRN